MSSRGKKNKTRRGKGGMSNAVDLPSRIKPPQIVTNVRVTRVYRYRASSATSQDISQNELIAAMGVMSTVATTSATAMFNTVKLHRVSVWTPPALDVASVANDRSCTITWNSPEGGSAIASGLEVSDSTMSNAYPAHISAKPPTGSLASFWLTAYSGTAAVNLFTIQCGAGSIVDVHVTAIMNDTNGANGLPYTTTAGPGLGVVYYPPLDGVTDSLLPVGLLTFT